MKDGKESNKSETPIYPNISNVNNFNMQDTNTKINNISISSISFEEINLKNLEKSKKYNDIIMVEKKVKDENNILKINKEKEKKEQDENEEDYININENLIKDDEIKESQRIEELLSEADLKDDNIKDRNNNLLNINNIKNDLIIENEEKETNNKKFLEYNKYKDIYDDKEQKNEIKNFLKINEQENNNNEIEIKKEESKKESIKESNKESNSEESNSNHKEEISKEKIGEKGEEKEEFEEEEKNQIKDENKVQKENINNLLNIQIEQKEEKNIEEKKEEHEEKEKEEEKEEISKEQIKEKDNIKEREIEQNKKLQFKNEESKENEEIEENKQSESLIESSEKNFEINNENKTEEKEEEKNQEIKENKTLPKNIETEGIKDKNEEKDKESNSNNKSIFNENGELKEILIDNINKNNIDDKKSDNNNINKEKKDPKDINNKTIQNEENNKVKTEENENISNTNIEKITEGFNLFNNFIRTKFKKQLLNNIKLRNSTLLKVNDSLIFLEKIYTKLNLFQNKKYFLNSLKIKNTNIKFVNTYSKKSSNIYSEEGYTSNKNINNNINFSKANSKIQNDIKKLELIKQRELEYIELLEKQKKQKQELINKIDNKIQKNLTKEENISKKNILNFSDNSSSSISDYLENKNNFKGELDIIKFISENNIYNNKLTFFENFNRRKSTKKLSKRLLPLKTVFSTKKLPSKNYDEMKPKYLSDKILEGKDENKSASSLLEFEDDNEVPEQKSDFLGLSGQSNDYSNISVDLRKLSEYDLFYKEQFFQNELFIYDVANIEDKVEADIKKEMNRLNLKQKLIAKKKLKEVNEKKNLDTKELQNEIIDLQEKYNKCKKKEEPKIELEMNNTEGYLHVGRMLGNYFRDEEEVNFPKFALESEKQTGARDIVDFKILRKEEVARRYFDYCCCLPQRKKINKILVYARYFCRFFVDNWIFDNLSLLIIIINTILILISDPTDPNNIGNTYDNYFLIFYTLEAILKIISFRFIYAEDAYIKDAWNILDFFVVIIGWISFILEYAMNGTKISGLAGLRAFRILRPFKTVKRFKGLKKLVTALLASISHLGETSIVLFFFFLIFSIAGTQMWQGIFFRRCMSVNYGYLVSTEGDTGMCSFDGDCEQYNTYGEHFICAKGYRNPNSGAVNFDNTLSAFVTVFVMVTLEGWTDIFTYVNKTFKDRIFINPIIIFFYFHTFIFIAAFYLINLFLAVTNSEFEHIETSRKLLKEKKSFYKLIKDRFDMKEREKKEKKEKERLLKASNNKKSNETLRELYYKITDGAYHIHTNKRNIPIKYSTVKDMYIMTNQNPENLYIQSKRIEEEETFLCDDIKRQQREIDELMKKKEKEEKQRKKIKKNSDDENEIQRKQLRKTRTLISPKKRNSPIKDNKANNSDKDIIKINNNNELTITKARKKKKSKSHIIKDDKINQEKIKHQISQEILREINKLNLDIIEMSIDSTQKFIKDKIVDMAKNFSDNFDKRKKRSDKKFEEDNEFDIGNFEYLENEKKEMSKRVNRTTQRIRQRRKTIIMAKMESESNKKKELSKEKDGYFFGMKPNNLEEKQKIKLPQQLSIINDLSLSDCDDNLNKMKILRQKTKKSNLHLLREKSLKLLNSEEENEKEEKNEENEKQNLLSIDKDSNSSILKERKVLIDIPNNFNVVSKFMKPKSNLEFFSKKRKEEFNKKRLKYIEKKYKLMKKETFKDPAKDPKNNSDYSEKDSEESFINFVNNVHNKENIDAILNLQKDKNILEDNKSYTKSLLEEDKSLISFQDEISLDELNLLPKEIKNNKIYKLDIMEISGIKKNQKLSKLIQLIRTSFFDRESINANINLTTKQQSDFLSEINKKLNNLLVIDMKKIRGRTNKNNDLDVSHVWNKADYEKFLEKKDDKIEDDKNDDDDININLSNKKSLNVIMKGYRNSIINNEMNDENKENKENEDEDIILTKKFLPKKSLQLKESMSKNNEFLYSHSNLLGPKKVKIKVDINDNNKDKGKNQEKEKDKDKKKVKINKIQTNKSEPKSKERDRSSLSKKNISSLGYFQKLKKNAKNKQQEKKRSMFKQKTMFVGQENNSSFIFKAKSIEKSIKKYPTENSKNYEIKEENRIYEEPLTVVQESVPDYLRGKKFYLNYIYNIKEKDLKVKDNFKVDHWVNEVFDKRKKYFKKKQLPENTEAFFVFNDKKLNLQKYSYMHHQDIEFQEKDLSYLTHNLKYFPLNVMQIMPMRLRNFGNYAVGREINPGIIGNKPVAMSQYCTKLTDKSRTGKITAIKPRNHTNIISGSSYANNSKFQEELLFKKNIYERIFKTVSDLNYNALSHYFLLEDKLYFSMADHKRREEYFRKEGERNREKENRFNVKSEIINILEFDVKTNSRKYIQWSGADILIHQEENFKNRKKWNNMINSLEDFNIIIWHKNIYVQRFQKLRYAFYILANNDYFDYTILGIVIINSIFMALDGNFMKPETIQKVEIANYVFNSIFILEYIVKFIGLGPFMYYSDAFTYLDTLIITFAILDMSTQDQDSGMHNVSSTLSFLRVFRIFRVIRLTKVLRRLKSMRLIIVSIKKALSNVSYIVCILIMFILIFQLLGMSLLSGNYHYRSFFIGFYTTYQILTLENWNSLLYEIWPMNYLCFFYFVAWIFIGNYVIFNLFISILLQSFDEEEEEDEDDLTIDEKIEKIYLLPAYLNMVKNSFVKDSNKKRLKSYRKKFDKNESDTNNRNDNINEEGSFINSQSFNQMKTSDHKITHNNMKESYFRSSTINERDNSFATSRLIESKSLNMTNNEEEEIDEYQSYVDIQLAHWKKVNAIFAKNECEYSLYILPQTSHFRMFCMKLIVNIWFDRFILFLILCSTARLVVDTFVSGYEYVLTFDILDAIFNILFLFECLFKIFAMGFVLDEGSYLRDNWNKIDIIIVICSAFDFQNLFTKYFSSGRNYSSIQFLKVIRLLRTLRPLRFISHNVQLKLIITSLFDSILPICNALFIVIVVYYMFSIVGISLFYSNIHNCYVMKQDGMAELATESFTTYLNDNHIPDDMESITTFCSDRYNGIMDTGPAFKFTNILTSFITSYVLSTMEGWPDIMNSYNIYGNYYGIFFIVYNLVVAYFFLNLFTGIMFRCFNEAFKRETRIAEDDKKAPKYYDFLTQIVTAEPHYIVWKKPADGTFAYTLREFADSTYLDNFIMIVIFLNMIFMALSFEGSSSTYNLFLTIVNYIFTGIFIAECIIKLLAYGVRPYFHSSWNRFDFFVVIASIVDLAVANIEGFDASFLKSFQIIRVLRVMRISRVLRLIKSLKGLEKLIQTLSWSLTALANVLLLMIIFFCIFAILGCYFYDNIIYEEYKDKFIYVNEYYNFDNFYYSFLIVFRCATGENWNNIMMEYAFIDPDKASEAYSYIFFIISNFVNSIIMLNLFLMVTLQQYDEFTNKNYNPIEKFESFLIDFNNAWNKFSDDENEGFRIKIMYVTQFFTEFNWKKLNFPEQGKNEAIKKYVSELRLRIDDEDYVYYHDVIYKIINRQMGSLIDRNNPNNITIFKKEKKVQKDIRIMINNYINKKAKKKVKKNQNLMITYNPLTSHLYFKMSYFYLKTFMKYYKENAELLEKIEEQSKNSNSLK